MLTTEAIITSLDLNTNKCSIRVPLFENANINTPAIMEAYIAIQPGSFNNYKVNDMVWITFIGTTMDTALIMGKIYKGPSNEIANSGGSLSIDSLRITGDTAVLPGNTQFNSQLIEYNSLDKLITKIKDLEYENIKLINQMNNLQTQITEVMNILGYDVVRDIDGEVLYDSETHMLRYKKSEMNKQ